MGRASHQVLSAAHTAQRAHFSNKDGVSPEHGKPAASLTFFLCGAGNIKINAKVSIAIASETADFHKLRGLSLAGLARRVADKQCAEELCLRLFRRLPQSRRFVPEDPQQLAVFEIQPVAISLVDYASGFGTSHLLEL